MKKYAAGTGEKRSLVTPLQAMIQAVASKMMPISSGVRLASPDRRTRKRMLRRRQRDNYERHFRDLNPAGTKMARLCQVDSKRAMDGTMR